MDPDGLTTEPNVDLLTSQRGLWPNGAPGLGEESLLAGLLVMGAKRAFHSGLWHYVDIFSPWSEIPHGETGPNALVSDTLRGAGSLITTV